MQDTSKQDFIEQIRRAGKLLHKDVDKVVGYIKKVPLRFLADPAPFFIQDFLYPACAFNRIDHMKEHEITTRYITVLEFEATDFTPCLEGIEHQLEEADRTLLPIDVESFILEIGSFIKHLKDCCGSVGHDITLNPYYPTLIEWRDKIMDKYNQQYIDRRHSQKKESVQLITPTSSPENGKEESEKEFTTARQVLAIHFILEYLQVRGVDRSKKAKFVQFVTGKNYKNIYDALDKPMMTKDKNFRFDDLQYIRRYFEDLGLSEIVKAINNQLDKPR